MNDIELMNDSELSLLQENCHAAIKEPLAPFLIETCFHLNQEVFIRRPFRLN